MRQPRRDTLFAMGLLSLQGLFRPVVAGAWSYYLRAWNAGSEASLRQGQAVVNKLTVMGRLVFVLTAIAFLVWFYRSYRRLGRLYPESTNYGPAAAVWGFFVPILNLFRPIEIALEIWRKTHLDRSWQLYIWWLTYLLAGLVGSLAWMVALTQKHNGAWGLIAGILIVSSSLYTLAAWLGVVVVRSISLGLDRLEFQKQGPDIL